MPFRYSAGIRLSRDGIRRRYLGRIELVKTSLSSRLSLTLGCLTDKGPIPVKIERSGRKPFFTTMRLPFSSVVSEKEDMYSLTSCSIAACKSFLAPSRMISSSKDLTSSFSCFFSSIGSFCFIRRILLFASIPRDIVCFVTNKGYVFFVSKHNI